MREFIRYGLLGVALAMAGTGTASAANVTLQLGHTMPPTHTHHASLVALADAVNKASKGEITIKIYPAEQLGNARDEIEALIRGSQDMGYDGAGVMSQFFPKISVLDMPFMFSSYEEMEKVFNSPVGQGLAGELLKARGLRLLSIAYYGARQISSNKPLEKVDDLKGLKIRTPQIKEWVDSFKAIGASPTPISFGEVYFALQTGVVDAQENPLSTIVSQKFYEVQKYITLTNHQIGADYLIVNDKKWQSLSPAHQKIIADEARKAAVDCTAQVKKEDVDLIKDLEGKGVKFIRPNDQMRSGIKAAVQQIYKNYDDKWGAGTVDRIREVLK